MKSNYLRKYKNIVFQLLIFCMSWIYPYTVSAENNITNKVEYTVTILPFDNLTGKSEYEWLSRGIAESGMADIARVEGIKIAERLQLSKVFKEIKLGQTGFIGQSSIQHIGKVVGADILIIGSYQIYNSNIRITCRLINTEQGSLISSFNKTGLLDNIFNLQNSLVRDITDALKVTISEDTLAEIKKFRPKSRIAFELFSKGVVEFNDNNFDEAIQYFERSIKKDKGYVQAWTFLAQTLSQSGRITDAISAYKEAITLDTKDESSRFMLAQLYQSMGLNHKADELYESIKPILKKQGILPVFGPVQEQQIKNYNEGKKWEKIIEVAKVIPYTKEINNDDIFVNTALPYLAIAYTNTGECGLGLYCINILKKKFRMGQKAHHWDRESIGDLEIVIKNKCAKIDNNTNIPNQWIAFNLWCDASLVSSSEKKIRLLEQAIKKDPKLIRPHETLARLHEKHQNYIGAVTCYKNVVALDYSDFISLNNLGTAYYRLGNTEGAKSALRKSARLSKNYFDPRVNLIFVLLGESNKKITKENRYELIRLAKECYEISPTKSDEFGINKLMEIKY